MDISYIEQKLKEIYQIKSRLMKEMNLDNIESLDSNKGMSFITKRFKRKFSKLKEMKIACIMDEFTYNSFEPECSLLQITPQKWKEEMEEFQPDIFFLESAWRGIEGLWNTKVAHLSDELIDVFNYCSSNDIPVVFWNKEDPVHFNTFITTAKYADFVFTTDIDCVKNYKTLLNHNRVFVLPFAAQTKFHNPLELYNRKDKFCFAGAYYKRYPDRARDLETFVDTIAPLKGLDIYDRNYYNQDPNYTFPTAYKRYIIGNLKADEMDKAYKGYRFNVNMNSVKQSQSMCARRIFELLASNTVAVSNYSRAIRNILGDLVICTDDGQRLNNEIRKFEDDEYYSKFRLQGLRKVLAEHTYSERLSFIIDKVYENPLENQQKQVAVFTIAGTIEQIEHSITQFSRQSYKAKKLFIITDISNYELISNDIEIINDLTITDILDIQSNFRFWAFISYNDYYGLNYINDFVLSTKYTDEPVMTKGTYFENKSGSVLCMKSRDPYRVIDHAVIRRSFVSVEHFTPEDLMGFVKSIEAGTISESCMSIDQYNYCMNYKDNECEVVDDLRLNDTGINLSSLYEAVERIEPNILTDNITLKSAEIFSLINSRSIPMRLEYDNLVIDSNFAGSHEYFYLNKLFHKDELNVKIELNLFLDVEFSARFSVDIVAIKLDKNQNKLESIVKPCNRKVTVELDDNTQYIKIGVRLAGSGQCNIRALTIGDIQISKGCFQNKSNTLLIADNYPSYGDLYRNAFIHSRLLEYKKLGQKVDVFKYNDRYPKEHSEFEGIDITCGSSEEANNVLQYGNYQTILIHFLSETIWNGIKNNVKGKRIIIWLHGVEVQSWARREYNFTTMKEKESAKVLSDKRLAFWRGIFDLALNNKEYDIHFVFVSNYLANCAFEDVQITLPNEKYSIIHNYINGDLFNYVEKDNDLRKKILSIRPFANLNYANDLTVKAIINLSNKPFFKDLEFKIIGKGELFNSTVKPLKKFKNVSVEEKFLHQEEIAALHKEYGLFLVPTRMDTQGVSRDEAMASGLVPISNHVAAVPEFVDNKAAILAEEGDHVGLAKGIEKLYQDADMFQRMSQTAAVRVRKQSGRNNTILKEILLIKPLKKTSMYK